MAYEIGSTVFAKTDNHPIANSENHWIGVITGHVRFESYILGYKCTTVYSDDMSLDHNKVLDIRYSDVDRYKLQKNDTVMFNDSSDNNGKEGRVLERLGAYSVAVEVDGKRMESYCSSLQLVAPSFALSADVKVGSKVRYNGSYTEFPKDITSEEPIEATVIGVCCGRDTNHYALYIPSTNMGHTCNGLCEDDHGWYVHRTDFEVVSEPESEPEAPAEEPNNTSFVVGDLVTYSLTWVSRPEPFVGEVVRIRDTTLWLKLHDAYEAKINRDGTVYCTCNANNLKHVCAYVKEDATKLILLMHNGAVVKHDRFTNAELTDDECYIFEEASVYDRGLHIGFPTYLGQSSYDCHAYTCELCGKMHLSMYDSPTEVHCCSGEDSYWCNSCVAEHATRCERCDEYYEDDSDFYEVRTNSDDPSEYECWCEDCTGEHAVLCEECDTYHSDYIYCPTCGRIGRINNYSYKPDPQFFKMEDEDTNGDTIYYGVENETEGSGNKPNDFSHELGLSTKEVYCKHDGSLDNGAEVVTHPCTIRYHLESTLWDRVSEAGAKYDMKSHDTRTCGLHVHFTRKPFEKITDYEEKITLAYDRFKSYWKAISRRRESNCRWSGFLSDKRNEKTNTKVADVKRKKDKYDRYQAVNLCNANTIEIRIFRGTLKVSTIKATLWLVDACNRFILNGGDVETCKFAELIDLSNAPDFVKEYLSAREIPIV